MNSAPIGIFDSGVGGLTVARSVLDLLPGESVLYIGDTAHSPYGTKPLATVRSLAIEVMDRLVDQGVKMLVIACNSASAAVLRDARERYTIGRGLPIVEVILPAARRAVAASRNGRIGVIGTQATVDSRAYNDALAVVPGIEIFSQACPEFVEVVEQGITTGPRVLSLAHEYLAPLREQEIDTLILGCTHYPLLAGAISYVMGDKVTLVSSADETARDVYRTLVAQKLLREDPDAPPQHRFVSTGADDMFQRLARRFLGPEVDQVEREVRSELAAGDRL